MCLLYVAPHVKAVACHFWAWVPVSVVPRGAVREGDKISSTRNINMYNENENEIKPEKTRLANYTDHFTVSTQH